MTFPPSLSTLLSFSTSYATPSLSFYSTFYFLWVFKFRAETSLQHFSNWFDGVQTSLVLMSVDSFIVAAIQCYLQPSLIAVLLSIKVHWIVRWKQGVSRYSYKFVEFFAAQLNWQLTRSGPSPHNAATGCWLNRRGGRFLLRVWMADDQE